MRQRLAVTVFLWWTVSAHAQGRWAEYRIGPFELLSAAGERESQELLNHLEQFRYTFCSLLGQPEAGSVFPIRIAYFRSRKDATAFGEAGPLRLKRECWATHLAADAPPSALLLHSLGRVLLESNTGRMPAAIESGLLDLFSTLQVIGTRVTMGAPPARRSRDWARMHLLSVDERYSGKLRVLLGNLQRGSDPDPAFRNAFERSPAEIEIELDAYLAGPPSGTVMLNAKAMNAQRLFGRAPEQGTAESLLAELRFNPGPGPHPLIAEALAAADSAGRIKALEALAERFPKWGEPVFQLAALEQGPGRRVALYEKAAKLEPRNSAFWKRLAEEQMAQKQFAAAGKSWLAAEHAAATPEERQALRSEHQGIIEQKLEFEAAEKRRIAEEEARALERLKSEAENRVREAELRANKDRGALAPGARVEQWWDGAQPSGQAQGMLEKVDCLKGMARLVIRAGDGKLVQLLVRDPAAVVIQGGGQTTLGCGTQRPACPVTVHYFPKPEKSMGTSGDAAVIEFR
jgi:hypothetical protein